MPFRREEPEVPDPFSFPDPEKTSLTNRTSEILLKCGDRRINHAFWARSLTTQTRIHWEEFQAKFPVLVDMCCGGAATSGARR